MPSTPIQTTPSSNPYLDAIQWGGWMYDDGATPGTNITYYLAPAGTDLNALYGTDVFGVSLTWTADGIGAFMKALQTWANVANITFTKVFTLAEADLVEYVYSNNTTGAGILGMHETPEAAASLGNALGLYNVSGTGYYGNQPGGYGFITLVHELGHALGLAHPHDHGGGSPLWPGVSYNVPKDPGDNFLNQGIFTTMTYNDGWNTGVGLSPSLATGWQAGPMAFDIAAIQYLYGANMSYNTGDNVYTIGDVLGFTCIWDAGGIDTIVAQNSTWAATINLNAATLLNEPGGGGFVSYTNGASTASALHWAGFTIANGVVIENATGGSGGDTIHLTSQNVNNLIDGNGGSDTVWVTYTYTGDWSVQAGSTAGNLVMLGSAGTDTFLDMEFVHFADGTVVNIADLIPTTPPADATSDFDGDGDSDILWYNADTGGVGQFVMNNGVPTWSGLGGVGGGWAVVGTGDFDGNGDDDILWYNSAAGGVSQFQMNDGVPTWAGIGGVGSGWAVVGAGDFDGDGTDDILWYNSSTGGVGQFVMDNGVPTWGGLGGVGGGWAIAGTGDFDGDGTDDILWFDASTGGVGQFAMDNGVPTWAGIGAVGSGWGVVGTGDFNGDGTDDILFNDSITGGVATFQMNNGVPTWNVIGGVGGGWAVVGTGDYDGDGTDDILWYNSATVAAGQFQMDNGVPTWMGIGTAGAGWQVIA